MMAEESVAPEKLRTNVRSGSQIARKVTVARRKIVVVFLDSVVGFCWSISAQNPSRPPENSSGYANITESATPNRDSVAKPSRKL